MNTIAMSQKRQWPTYLQRWIGQFAIRILPELHNRAPQVVYISHITRDGYLTGQVLNSNEILITKPHQLVPYTPRLYSRLHAQELYRMARATMQHQAERAVTGKYR